MLIYGFKLVVIPFHEDHTSQSNHISHGGQDEHATNEQENRIHEKDSIKMDEKTQSSQPSSTHTSLSSYTIDLRKLDNWLEMRIIDIEFLYGYYEPTLFILCESTMTWVGRYSVRKDTCNSVALSLNLTQKIHPIIWPVDKLPSDCLKCYAVPQPIGGMIIFAVNSLIYINQSVPSYAISLNSMAKLNSAYPFKSMEHVKCTLDMSQATFIEPNRLIVSLKAGELYIITLLTDSESLRTVRNVHIEKGPSSVISSCLSKCGEQFLFIGSRLGNSVLLKYSKTAKSNAVSASASNVDANMETVDSLDTRNGIEVSETTNGDLIKTEGESEYDELDKLLELNEVKCMRSSSETIVTHSFDVCDILLNVAPCGHSIIGESVGDYSEFATSSTFPNIDLVTSSGHTKNGAISILQRSLRPECIATFQIPDIVDMWSVSNYEKARYMNS